MSRTALFCFAILITNTLRDANWNEGDLVQWIADTGGRSMQDSSGHIVGIELMSTWITDADLARLAALPHLQHLDLSHTHVTDVGMEHLKALSNISELNLYYAEFI